MKNLEQQYYKAKRSGKEKEMEHEETLEKIRLQTTARLHRRDERLIELREINQVLQERKSKGMKNLEEQYYKARGTGKLKEFVQWYEKAYGMNLIDEAIRQQRAQNLRDAKRNVRVSFILLVLSALNVFAAFITATH